jgi:hypothetical protein
LLFVAAALARLGCEVGGDDDAGSSRVDGGVGVVRCETETDTGQPGDLPRAVVEARRDPHLAAGISTDPRGERPTPHRGIPGAR